MLISLNSPGVVESCGGGAGVGVVAPVHEEADEIAAAIRSGKKAMTRKGEEIWRWRRNEEERKESMGATSPK